MGYAERDNSVGAYEAKTHFAQLLERVARGEEIVITKHGHPVAKLVPTKLTTTAEGRRKLIDEWRETAKGLSLGGHEIEELIAEGRT